MRPAQTFDLGNIQFLKFVEHSREIGRKLLFGNSFDSSTSNIFFLGKTDGEIRLFSIKMNPWMEVNPKLFIIEGALDYRIRYEKLVHAFFMMNEPKEGGALIMQFSDKI